MALITSVYDGCSDREAVLDKLGRVAGRLGVPLGKVRVRPLAGSAVGMELALGLGGTVVRRTCDSQVSREANLGALVQWAEDLARNAERGIERLEDALHGDGASLAVREPEVEGRRHGRRLHLYHGGMTGAEAWHLVRRSATRLGLDPDRAVWLGPTGRGMTLRLDLGGGRMVEKSSYDQPQLVGNAAALALWLQCRARHHERGIDRDLAKVMSAYLLAEGA
jgi:hypothetical protein